MASQASEPRKSVNRLVLCFDGTGNQYMGAPSDTNIVKLYEMLDRRAGDQYHYYQPGIGTYTGSESDSLLRFWPAIKAKVLKSLDQGLGITFQEHVLAGYKFLMTHYSDGDEIYIFGFSRGAYTARFLSQMIFRIGLLSRGNYEMVHFAWTTFSDWLRTTGDETPEDEAKRAYMDKFKKTFCRDGVEVFFLGIFDCVNSVGTFEAPFWKTSYKHMPLPPAKHIRHAVSIHERRLKFKPALFEADLLERSESVKEVWFCGNHSDIGGGWGYEEGQVALLSDEPLQWMIDEVLGIDAPQKLKFLKTVYEPIPPEPEKESTSWFSWPSIKRSKHEARMATMRPHDQLSFGGGAGYVGVLTWWIMEILPIFSRLELEDGVWVPRHWPPNLGAMRDLPSDAVLHRSVYALHRAGVMKELPKLGGDGPPRLPKVSSALFDVAFLNEDQANDEEAAAAAAAKE